jgi:YbbR domain-containing protein
VRLMKLDFLVWLALIKPIQTNKTNETEFMNFLKKHILNDFKLKILSLVLALMLWVAVAYMGESRMSIAVRVSAENLGRNLIISKMDPDEVLVTLDGPISILKNIRSRDVRIPLDLANVKEGRQVFSLNKDNVFRPEGLRVDAIKPDYVVIETDSIMEKRLKTVVKLDKKWMSMYAVKSWAPRYVTVEGSRDALKGRDSIVTLPVDGGFLSEEEEVDVGLDTKDMVVRRIVPDNIKVILRRR